MKIDSIGKVDALTNQMSITKINDDDKKQQHINVPVLGYKTNHSILILKFNKFVISSLKKESDDDSDGSDTSESDSTEKGSGIDIDPLQNVIFQNDITEDQRKEVQKLLDELNKYNQENDSSMTILLTSKNIDEFITILQELRVNDLYFGREKKHVDGEPGKLFDFKA